ncbi:hypothetical protein [Limnovirga soli]|uniref:Auto-transporter adhesin head GIN domain-containing protein n=1 Tax=Limnovirga soli TaxID=2656915 RepID=A0A8J8JWN0_9BACT|nr:hypothetical protein [Limnovirga soli]NNV57904.1 hypothetical protein [Limnovirga soli]
MKNKLHQIVSILLFTAVSTTSCTKAVEKPTTVTPVEPVVQAASTFADIKVNSSFEWNNARQVAVNVEGIATSVPVKNTLFITSEDRSEVYFSANIAMSQNKQAVFLLPEHVRTVLISYGSIHKTIQVTGNNISFNYLSN